MTTTKKETPISLRLLLFTSLILSCLFAVEIWSWDIWWHLATGRWIVEHGRIPDVDPFSYTALGAPWINVNWLGAMIYYAAWQLGNAVGVVILKMLLGFLMILNMGLILRTLDIRRGVTVACLISFTVLVQPRFCMARPMVIGAVLCAFSVFTQLRLSISPSRYTLLQVPLTFVWMNIHSSAIIMLPLIAMLFIYLLFWRKERIQAVLSGVAFLLILALFVATDRGWGILTQALAYDEHSIIVRYTNEWRSLSLSNRWVWIPWSLFAVTGVFGVLNFRRYPFLVLLLIPGIALGTRFARHLYIGLFFVLPLATVMFNDLSIFLEKHEFKLACQSIPLLILLAVAGLHLAAERRVALQTGFGFHIIANRYPEKCLKVLKTLPEMRTFHNYHLGGYLTFFNIPGGVFMDGRSVQVFRDAHFKAMFEDMKAGPEALERLADRYNIGYGIGDIKASFDEILMISPHWIPLYFGDNAVLHVREKYANKLTRHGIGLYPSLRYVTDPDFMRTIYKSLLPNDAARNRHIEEFLLAAKQNPHSPTLMRILSFHLETDKQLAKRIRRRLRAMETDGTSTD